MNLAERVGWSTMSYTVSQPVQEYGIRMAVGATAGQVLRMVLAQGATLVMVGIGFGLTNAGWATSLLISLLFGVSSHDLVIYGLAIPFVSGTGRSKCHGSNAARVKFRHDVANDLLVDFIRASLGFAGGQIDLLQRYSNRLSLPLQKILTHSVMADPMVFLRD
jgi:ABC-type antimicrobial peptide transport system permease subunit